MKVEIPKLIRGGSGAGGGGGTGGGDGGGGTGSGGGGGGAGKGGGNGGAGGGGSGITLLRFLRNRWNYFVELSQLATYSGTEQMEAFRMALDPAMQQVVEVTLGILPTTITMPDLVLDLIADYIRAKRHIAFDRVAFEERRQGPSETFDDFYIGLERLADAVTSHAHYRRH
ncbi:hypothetical protein OUZ56_025553 [Daphnia magna]|uniref:Uncharacterized protein n=1 Tax=Daphnia magna TaxID=35525 RepID=A0ABQ9ZK75_9CRUS|nr:hypothetical protein OUZ56_025553 [Daphnia magna]